MSKLFWDPRPRATRKPPASSTASASTSEPKPAAAPLLLRRAGGRATAKDESIDLFSALKKCQPERGGRRGSGGGELPSTATGKHDYDWLLTPPATPLWSPATRATGRRQVSAAAPGKLARARSSSHAKSDSRLSLMSRESGNPTSRLARSTSATHPSIDTPVIAPPGRTWSSASSSSSSINTVVSNAPVSSTPLGSAPTSPRTPSAARGLAAAALPRRLDSVAAALKTKATPSSSSGPSTPTTPRAAPSSPRSTSPAAPTATRRGANALARSRFACQSSAGSTSQDASLARVRMRSSSKPRQRPTPTPAAAKKHHGDSSPAASTTTLSWRSSSAYAVNQSVTPRKVPPPANRSSRNGDGGWTISTVKAAPRRNSGPATASVSVGLTKNGSRKSAAASTNAKRTVSENDGRRGAITSRSSRLGITPATSGRRSTSEKAGKMTAAARVAAQDAFPSTRYDAMLLREEDPKNLTWLLGYSGDDDDGGGGGAGFAEGFVEPLDLPNGMGGAERYH